MHEGIVSLEGVGHRYGGMPVVRGVDLGVGGGEIVAFLGASGCGKSTLLRAMAGFVTPTEGRIRIGGRVVAQAGREVVPAERRGVGVVFQDFALFGHMTVARNVEFGLGRDRGRRTRAAEVLEAVGMASLADRYPRALSGGQQQRVALARALAPRPALLLLDEPFANLDAALRVSLRRDLRDTLRHEGASAVLVTHDRHEALSIADRVAVLGAPSTGEPATVLQVGPPSEVYAAPDSTAVAALTGDFALLSGDARGEVADTAVGEVPLSRPVSGPVRLIVRPEAARFVAGPGDCRVRSRQYQGPVDLLEVETPAGLLVVQAAPGAAQEGDTGTMRVVAPCPHVT